MDSPLFDSPLAILVLVPILLFALYIVVCLCLILLAFILMFLDWSTSDFRDNLKFLLSRMWRK